MNTIYFKLEEEIQKKQQTYAKMDINMFDEIILGNMPNIYNFFKLNVSSSDQLTYDQLTYNDQLTYDQKGGNFLDKREKYRSKLFRLLINDVLYKNIFAKTNYLKYKNKMLINYIYTKFNINLKNSIAIVTLREDKIDDYNIDYKTTKIQVNDLKIKDKYDFICFSFKLSITNNYELYSESEKYLNDIVSKNINKGGNLLLELQFTRSDAQVTSTLFNNLLKQFEHLYLIYMYDPFILGLSPRLLCMNKENYENYKNVLNNDQYELFLKKMDDALEFNYTFINYFLLYDDVLRESIIYKIMSKF